MLIRCAWCNSDLGIKPDDTKPETAISHTICEACRIKLRAQSGMDMQEYLDTFSFPIIIVDTEITVVAANIYALDILGQNAASCIGQRWGKVFECIHARLPEGCGNTIHCFGCTIRRAVLYSFSTGEPQTAIPAYRNPSTPDYLRHIEFYVSTIKHDNCVQLRIDLP